MDYRVFTDEEQAIIIRNVTHYTRVFKTSTKNCQHAECGYPLPPDDLHFFVIGTGHVCDLCYALHQTVKDRLFFVNAHKEFELEKTKMKRMRDGDNW